MAHEVEAGHEQDQVRQQQPVALDGDFSFREEDVADRLVVAAVAAGFDAHALALAVGLGLGHHEAEDDEEDGRTGAEPVERAPAVGGGVDEAAGEGGSEEISKGVLLDDELEFVGLDKKSWWFRGEKWLTPCCSIPEMMPRASDGQSSRAVAAAFPYRPPMATPNSARQARNCL